MEGESEMKLVKVATAYTNSDVMRIRMLLGRIGVPFMVKNDAVKELFGGGSLGGFNVATGPVEFWANEGQMEEVQQGLEAAFTIHTDDIPTHCPACGAATTAGLVDCPNCGLFLG